MIHVMKGKTPLFSRAGGLTWQPQVYLDDAVIPSDLLNGLLAVIMRQSKFDAGILMKKREDFHEYGVLSSYGQSSNTIQESRIEGSSI